MRVDVVVIVRGEPKRKTPHKAIPVFHDLFQIAA